MIGLLRWSCPRLPYRTDLFTYRDSVPEDVVPGLDRAKWPMDAVAAPTMRNFFEEAFARVGQE